MSDRPIIFSAPMIRALLDGRKTQTRRLLKSNVPTPPADTIRSSHIGKKLRPAPYLDSYCNQRKTAENPRGMSPFWCWWTRDDRMGREFKVPYVPGDRLWVREAWADVNTSAGPGIGYRSNGAFHQPEYDGPNFGAGPSYNYDKYPGNYTMWFSDLLSGSPGHGWRSPIHMPRWASRLTLTVTEVRVQRLWDISEDDARAEGEPTDCSGESYDPPSPETDSWQGYGRYSFCLTWSQIHGPGTWDKNPWVAALTFTVTRANIDSKEPQAA